ncbi:MAG: BspA family leucine-rich repeat surface protein [Muribaculaceae bacterium]|nr:BspA family leucine-rich repeat surface protein [Muribaculaceae bacterium]
MLYDHQDKLVKIGQADGIAPLNGNTKIDEQYLPSYVDDVIEYQGEYQPQMMEPLESTSHKSTDSGCIVFVDRHQQTMAKNGYFILGDPYGVLYKNFADKDKFVGDDGMPYKGKIYVSTEANLQLRWSGSMFVQIGSGLKLGETAGDAYPGDKGKANADAISQIQDDMLVITYGETPFSVIQQAILDYKYLACYETTERKAYHIVSYSATGVQMQCVVGNVNYGIAVTSANQWSKASLTLPKVEYVDDKVAAEATARANADNALTTSISNEAAARQSADNNLAAGISGRVAKPSASVAAGKVATSNGSGDVTWEAAKDERLPEAAAADAGKVVRVDEAGEYELSDKMATKQDVIDGCLAAGTPKAYLKADELFKQFSSSKVGYFVWEDADGVEHTRLVSGNTFAMTDDEKAAAVKVLHAPINERMTHDVPASFNEAVKITEVDTTGWNIHITSLTNFFRYCHALKSVKLRGFVTNVVHLINTFFYQCWAMTEADVRGWDTSAVTNMYGMFGSCYALKSLDLSSWDTSVVTNMTNMFIACNALRYITLSAAFFGTSQSLPFNGAQRLGFNEGDATSNGWIEHVAEVAPDTGGVAKNINLHANLYGASFAQTSIATLRSKGYTVNNV